MQVKTILNHVERHSSFVYGSVRWREEGAGKVSAIEVEIRPRANSRPVCSGCGRSGPGYDRLPTREFEFVPLWAIPVFLIYAMRRVDCPRCGVCVETVPWAEGKCHLTNSYRWFLAGWAKLLSWAEVARVFRTCWDNVFRSVEMAVHWGRGHMDLDDIQSIGVDEIQWRCGHKYLTLVYQIDPGQRRLLWVGENRQVKTLLRFFRWLGKERAAQLQYICSDMWKPYLKVIRKKAAGAIHVLDRYHIMSHFSKAIDEVRASEAKRLAADGYEPVLTRTRWLLLKRPEHLSEKQDFRLAELLKYNLRTVRAYILKEDFQRFWEYISPYWAGKFLDAWCTKTMRSKIDPMKRVAKMLRAHNELIINWFKARGQISAGTVEGFNNKAKLTTRKAYGFRSLRGAQVALYHTLGNLPQPKLTHRFC